ncbi:DUF481 domain-containing protein [Psychromonas hadalis]|uniref:DUF481 domain-containing protein n=1 Tax=Psychromonas hadalis TaxID=211669 RepID=UPI0003B78C52|nr:DUF481 domain-containing protein [Psychromonas hadalis]
MVSRWFYILLANVAVLVANVWLFTDKPLPVQSNNSEIISTPTTPLPINALTDEISSLDSFHFSFNDPFAPQQEDLQPQLDIAIESIAQKNSALKKERRAYALQNNKIALLSDKNRRLQQKLVLFAEQLSANKIQLSQQNQKLEQFILVLKDEESGQFQTDIGLVKKSIQYQPDLVKIQSAKKASSTENSAEDATSKDVFIEDKRLSGSIEFGFNYEQDNQVTKQIKGRLILDYDETDKYNINSDLDFEFENEDDEMSTEKYRWQLQVDYNLDPTNLMFARSDISRSQFSSYDQEDIFTVGYGRIFFNTVKHKFNIEIGPGYRFAVPNIGEDAVSVDEFIVRTRLNYERIVTESLQVKLDAVLEAGHNNSVYSLNFKAQNRLYQELYLIFDLEYKFTQNVPVDTVNKEVVSGLSLLYAF